MCLNPCSVGSVQDRRHAEFVGIKRQIIHCMEELEQEPDTSFERDVVCEDEDAFCLSTDNIVALQQLLTQVGLAYATLVIPAAKRPFGFTLNTECV